MRKIMQKIGAFALASALVIFSFGKIGQIPQKAAAEGAFGWEKISSYTTYFSKEEGGRYENIQLATTLIDGITIQPYGTFSFNQTVGRRTKEAGFQEAKVISQGEYVLGVGGGVCQVSTTLYNAALKSGLCVTEVHPHSLRVGYVPPSRDAMVSSESDLCFYNPHLFPVYLEAKVHNNALKIAFYGKNEGYRYEITSKIVGEIPPPLPLEKEGDWAGVLRVEQVGIQSEAYLEKYLGNALLSRKLLRKDEYRPIQGIIVKKNEDTTKKTPFNACLFFKNLL